MTIRIFQGLLLCLLTAASPAQQLATAAIEPLELPAPGADADRPLDALLTSLADASLAKKGAIIAQLAADGSPAAHRALRALHDGLLYFRQDNRELVTAEAQSDPLQLTDVKSGAALGAHAATAYTRITLNNQLRRTLRGQVATLNMASDDAALRLAAVREMLRTMDEPAARLLRAHRDGEPDPAVQREMDTALALTDLASPASATRLAAVHTLGDSLHPEVYNRLAALLAPPEGSGSAEADPQVRAAVEAALSRIEGSRRLMSRIETLFFGLSLGSVLVLAGIGLAITFGVMGVINMAHGELMMLGAYSVYVVQQLFPGAIGASLFIAIPVAFLVTGLVGVLIERGVVRFLYGRPLETLLATFGVSLILQQLVRDVFSPNNRPVLTPQWMAGSWQVNEVLAITWSRIYIVVFAMLVFAALIFILKRTSLGLHVRAVSQNRAMARAMGIRTDWVDAMTFGLGAGIAGVAGVALSQLTNVGPNLGQSYIIDSFMVVVFGGVGNLWGTLISGLSLGVANKLLEPVAGAVLAKILVLVALILFIQRRPRGLFPQKGRAAEG